MIRIGVIIDCIRQDQIPVYHGVAREMNGLCSHVQTLALRSPGHEVSAHRVAFQRNPPLSMHTGTAR